MNLVKECPDISDNWKGGVNEVCKILGLSREKIRLDAIKGKRNGGIDWYPGKNGRKQFLGKEVKRYWKSF